MSPCGGQVAQGNPLARVVPLQLEVTLSQEWFLCWRDRGYLPDGMAAASKEKESTQGARMVDRNAAPLPV